MKVTSPGELGSTVTDSYTKRLELVDVLSLALHYTHGREHLAWLQVDSN